MVDAYKWIKIRGINKMIIALILLFIISVSLLIGAKFSKTDKLTKKRMKIIYYIMLFAILAFAAFLIFILIPSM